MNNSICLNDLRGFIGVRMTEAVLLETFEGLDVIAEIEFDGKTEPFYIITLVGILSPLLRFYYRRDAYAMFLDCKPVPKGVIVWNSKQEGENYSYSWDEIELIRSLTPCGYELHKCFVEDRRKFLYTFEVDGTAYFQRPGMEKAECASWRVVNNIMTVKTEDEILLYGAICDTRWGIDIFEYGKNGALIVLSKPYKYSFVLD